MESSIYITGTEVNYYFICHRKLWLFSRQIHMEHESEAVQIGRLIHEHSYERETKKEIELDDIKIDFMDLRNGIIHEVKKSDSKEDAHRWQLLYYIYYLKSRGVEGITGEIDYPKLKQKETVELMPENEKELCAILDSIALIKNHENAPERINKKSCKHCSYYELCWA